MAEKKVVPPDELHHQSKPMYPLQKHPVYNIPRERHTAGNLFEQS
jgi:hypothetical protein